MTTLQTYEGWPTLVGRQQPEHVLVNEGDQSEAEKAVTLATRVRKAQMPWQESTLRGILTIEPDGLFTHPTSVIIAPRQNGKTLSAAELRILYGLFHRREWIVYSAQRWTTAKAIYLRLKRLIGARPSLKRRVVGWVCSQGVASITVRFDDGTERIAMFITRSADFRGPDEIDLVIYDESYNLTDSEMAAISPTQLASRNPQTIYLSSAVNQQIHANGGALARLRRRALKAIAAGEKQKGLYFAEYMAPEPPAGLGTAERTRMREDPETWRAANPSYGVIQNDAKVLKLLTELSPQAFEVEVLGWGDWPVDEADQPALIDLGQWRKRAVMAPQLTGARAISLDREPNGGPWVVTAAQYTVDGRIYLEVGYNQAAPAMAMVRQVRDIAVALNPVALAIDSKSDAAVLKADLIEAGIDPTLTNTTDYGFACGGFLNDALDGRLTHGDQPVLNGAIAVAAKYELPRGGFLWDGVAAKGAIAALRSASLARWALIEFGSAVKPVPAAPVVVAPAKQDGAERRSSEIDFMTVAF